MNVWSYQFLWFFWLSSKVSIVASDHPIVLCSFHADFVWILRRLEKPDGSGILQEFRCSLMLWKNSDRKSWCFCLNIKEGLVCHLLFSSQHLEMEILFFNFSLISSIQTRSVELELTCFYVLWPFPARNGSKLTITIQKSGAGLHCYLFE